MRHVRRNGWLGAVFQPREHCRPPIRKSRNAGEIWPDLGLGTALDKVRIATRRSKLALWQASFIKGELERSHPGLVIEIAGISTAGDRWLDAPLSEVGGKGLFINELEAALARGGADLAVHSMKDVPAVLDSKFAMPVIGYRQDVRDAWVSPHGGLKAMPPGAAVGTSSLRRQAQILALRPDLRVRPLRGNVDTRLAKLDAAEVDAIVLAMAGLARLGWAERVTEALPPSLFLPAPGQGALGVECRADDDQILALLAPLRDPATAACVEAERGVSAALGADCSQPLAAYAQPQDEAVLLQALLASPDGGTVLKAKANGPAEQVANLVVADLKAQGALRLLHPAGA